MLAVRVIQHVVRDLIDGPFQTGNDAAVESHAAHHDVHERVHEVLLLFGITEALGGQVPVVDRITLPKACGFQEMGPVRVEEETLKPVLLGERDGDVDGPAPECVCAREKRDHSGGKCGLACREVQHNVLVAPFTAFVEAAHELTVGERVDPADEPNAIPVANDDTWRASTLCAVRHGDSRSPRRSSPRQCPTSAFIRIRTPSADPGAHPRNVGLDEARGPARPQVASRLVQRRAGTRFAAASSVPSPRPGAQADRSSK